MLNAVDSTLNLTFRPGQDAAIGRDKELCGPAAFPDAVILSRVHCSFTITEQGEAAVQDLSSNGTFLNGARIGKGNRRVLRKGDTVTVAPPGSPFGEPALSWTYDPPEAEASK